MDLKFDPTGRHIASGGMDKNVLLWNVYGDCENYGLLKGAKGAITALEWGKDGGKGGTADKVSLISIRPLVLILAGD